MAKHVVAGNDLTLTPTQVAITPVHDAQGAVEGYTIKVRVCAPSMQGAMSVDLDSNPKGKRALKAGPDKLRWKALKHALTQVKALKQLWTFRYQEIKAQLAVGRPPRKPRTPKPTP